MRNGTVPKPEDETLNPIQLHIDDPSAPPRISEPKLFPEGFRYEIPEFNGRTGEGAFTVNHQLVWRTVEGENRLKFRDEVPPEEAGIELKGSLTPMSHEVVVKAQLRNVTAFPILGAHHSLVLNLDGQDAWHDPTGERTYYYAETGWTSLAQLLDPIHSGKHTVRMGASYNSITVMWKLVVRTDPEKKVLLAFALDKGYAFAGDHPDWPKGVLGAYRWGAIGPGETKELKGKIYLFKGTLNELRMKYVNDFK